MALGDFFRINLPYGIKRNNKDEWFVFNREYMPLGYNTTKGQVSLDNGTAYADLPIHTKYRGLTEAKLLKIAGNEAAVIRRDGKINMIFLYNDSTNPQLSPKEWDTYFKKIQQLSKLNQNR